MKKDTAISISGKKQNQESRTEPQKMIVIYSSENIRLGMLTT